MSDQPADPSNSGLFRKAVAGGCAGIANDFLMHPMDNIRARLQIATPQNISPSSAFYASSRSAFFSPLRALKFTCADLVRGAGFRGFYQGFSSVVLFSLPCNAAYFTCYDVAKNHLEDSPFTPLAKRLSEPLGGLFAQFCVSFLWTPYDIVKQRMMVSEKGRCPALFPELHRIVVNGEALRGLQASWITWGPFSMVYFGVFESLRRQLLHRNFDDHWSTDLIAGTVAGITGAVVSQPADTIKTRMQVLEAGSLGARRSFFSSAVDVVRAGGFRLLWRGVVGRVLWIAPGTSISITVWNLLK